jgi:hypothetical protein
VDERVASDRELGQVVAAAGLGASGERGSDPDSGEGDQAHEGRVRMATTFERIGACRSMGSFLALQRVGRCGPPGMASLVCRFRKNLLFARNVR